MTILIVEDESPIAEGLKFNFEQEGYSVEIAGDGSAAMAFFNDHEVELIVLDLMLPGMSGYEICKEIREQDKFVPIMVLSARSNSQDKAHAFDCGADQYVTKPFDLQEVISRIRGLLRRREQESENDRGPDSTEDSSKIYQFGDVTVDCNRFEVTVGETTHTLTTMEMQLLQYFIENEGNVLSRANILRDVWEQSPDITTRSIDNFVLRLRKILEPMPGNPQRILSVRGTGYRFVGEPESDNAAT